MSRRSWFSNLFNVNVYTSRHNTGVPDHDDGRYRYDAFLSYSRTADTELASALRFGLHAFGRGWKWRAVRVFRDDSSLSANPGLWPAVERALNASRIFILLASRQSAASRWVDREVRHWCEHRDADHILLVLTDPPPGPGDPPDIAWDEEHNDFDWSQTTVLPPSLSGVFDTEPGWIRLARPTGAPLSRSDPRFQDAVASLAAALHGRPKDELIGEDVRERQLRRMAFRAGIALITVVVVVATWQYIRATIAEREAKPVGGHGKPAARARPVPSAYVAK